MIHKIFSFFDNDLRYNLIFGVLFALVPIFYVALPFEYLSDYLFMNYGIDTNNFGYLTLIKFLWHYSLMELFSYEYDDVISVIYRIVYAAAGIVMLSFSIASRIIIFIDKNKIKLYRRLVLTCYNMTVVTFILFFLPIIIVGIIQIFLDNSPTFIAILLFGVPILLPLTFIIYRIIRRGVKNTLSDNILNFCKDKAG